MSTPQEAPPRCNSCNTVLTIKHILNDCINFNRKRAVYFGNKPAEEILGNSENFNVSKCYCF